MVVKVEFDHSSPTLHGALGISEGRKNEIVDMVIDIIEKSKSVSESMERVLNSGLRDNELLYAVFILREVHLGKVAWMLVRDTADLALHEKDIINDVIKHVVNIGVHVEKHGMPGDAKKFLIHVMAGLGAALVALSCINNDGSVNQECVKVAMDAVRATSFLAEDVFNGIVGQVIKHAFWRRFSI